MFASLFPAQRLTVRPTGPDDRGHITSLLQAAPRFHAHLDWRPIEDWLGHAPFLLAESGGQPVGALACPPDPPDVAWLRLFATTLRRQREVWEALWAAGQASLQAQRVRLTAGLSLDGWMDPLYLRAGFELSHAVVVLICRLPEAQSPAAVALPPGLRLRPAGLQETEQLAAVDFAAFTPPWQISGQIVQEAVAQADYVTVIEADGELVAYQLTTPSQHAAHLARLAVRPAWQGRGLGSALVTDLIQHYSRRGLEQLTVNTQDNNAASLRVYQQLGFRLNGQRYPVYQMRLG